ncbi:hypothetical protein HELRODRAFT_160935 [Helobdella robusta]|uniref:C2H2-type domain-containing protein n=1 Tax=Helobdella robusta TaxID=6412 RepID=T1EQV7_HELRO|nr:hypothetical protein HELRODRAFT_160935 [Helobdella robusta]ESO01773.1 hypothetical protein HELRODRAFT_160935 [Helobdella robusta]
MSSSPPLLALTCNTSQKVSGQQHKSLSYSTIKCSICSKTFNNSSALAKHKLIHSNERRNGHMMTHAEKKPHTCKFPNCDKSYCDARSLRRHYDNFHKLLHHQQQLMNKNANLCNVLQQESSILTPGLTPRSAGIMNSNKSNNANVSGNESVFNFENINVNDETIGTINFNSNISFASHCNISNTNDDFCNKTDNNIAGSSCVNAAYAGDNPSGLPATSLASSLMQMSPVSPLTGNNSSNINSATQQLQQNSIISDFNPFNEYKPVKCKQCDKCFKNMPALNGHMRLHGGFIKKLIINHSQAS